MIGIIELTTVCLLEAHCALLQRCVLTGLVIYVAVRLLLQWLCPAETFSVKWSGGAIVIGGLSLTSKLIHGHEPHILSLRLGNVSVRLANHLHPAVLRCLRLFVFLAAIHIDDLMLFAQSGSTDDAAEAIHIRATSFVLCSEYAHKCSNPSRKSFDEDTVNPKEPPVNKHDPRRRYNMLNHLGTRFTVHLNARNLLLSLRSASDEVSAYAVSCAWVKSWGPKMSLQLNTLKIEGNIQEVGFQLDSPSLAIELASNKDISCRSKEKMQIALRDRDKNCRITTEETHFEIAWTSGQLLNTFKNILGHRDRLFAEMPSSLRLNAGNLLLSLRSASDEVSVYAASCAWVKSAIVEHMSIQTTKLQINGNILGVRFHLDCPSLPVELSPNLDIRCHSKDKIHMEIRRKDTNYRESSEEADFTLVWKSPNRDTFRSHFELSVDLRGFFLLHDPLNLGWYADQLSLKRRHDIIRVMMVSMAVNRCGPRNSFHVDCPNLKITFSKGSASKLSICCDSRHQIRVQLNVRPDEKRLNDWNRSFNSLTEFGGSDVSFELTASRLSVRGDLFGTPVDLLMDKCECTDLRKAKAEQLHGLVQGYNVTLQNPRFGLDCPNEEVWNACDAAHIDMSWLVKCIASLFLGKTVEQQLRLNTQRLNDNQLELIYTIGVAYKKFCDILLAIMEKS